MRKILAFLWSRENDDLRMPEGAKIVAAETEQPRFHRVIRVLAECDNSKEYVKRKLSFVEAGGDVPRGAKLLCQIRAKDVDCFLYDLGEEPLTEPQ